MKKIDKKKVVSIAIVIAAIGSFATITAMRAREKARVFKSAQAYGLVAAQTKSLISYCGNDAPNEYISKLAGAFKDDIVRTEKIFETRPEEKMKVEETMQRALPSLVANYETDRKSTGKSKKEYCKLYDTSADIMIAMTMENLERLRNNDLTAEERERTKVMREKLDIK